MTSTLPPMQVGDPDQCARRGGIGREPGGSSGGARRPSTGRTTRKSWTTSHPVGVCQVVSSTIVPGRYLRWLRDKGVVGAEAELSGRAVK